MYDMEKGRILFLNGVTSSGKTSIVEALQERDDVFFMLWQSVLIYITKKALISRLSMEN